VLNQHVSLTPVRPHSPVTLFQFFLGGGGGVYVSVRDIRHNRDAKMAASATAIRDNVISVTRCDVMEMTL